MAPSYDRALRQPPGALLSLYRMLLLYTMTSLLILAPHTILEP